MARPHRKTRPRSDSGQSQKLRITGGDWRGRRLQCLDSDGLRPTLAQNRERLGNWLQHRLVGRVLLDGFAGTGILGLEGLSRGAAWCDWVESAPRVAAALRESLSHLGDLVAERGQVHQGDLLSFLRRAPRRYDGVFLDPPFASGLTESVLTALVRADCLNPSAWVYLEMPMSDTPPEIPPTLRLDRESSKGQIRQWLLVAADPGFVESAQGSR